LCAYNDLFTPSSIVDRQTDPNFYTFLQQLLLMLDSTLRRVSSSILRQDAFSASAWDPRDRRDPQRASRLPGFLESRMTSLIVQLQVVYLDDLFVYAAPTH